MSNRTTQALIVFSFLSFLIFCSEIANIETEACCKIVEKEPAIQAIQVADLETIMDVTVEKNEDILAQASFLEAEEPYYVLTEEETRLLQRLVFAESGNQGLMGMVYVANATINDAIARGISIKEDINSNGRYSTVHDGEIGHWKEDEFIVITEEQVTDEAKEAVEMAQEKDYTLKLLREVADELDLDESYYEDGARYFYAANESLMSQKELNRRKNIKVSFQYKDVIFYAAWK